MFGPEVRFEDVTNNPFFPIIPSYYIMIHLTDDTHKMAIHKRFSFLV